MRIYKRGDGTPQLVRPVYGEDPMAPDRRRNPDPPCIILGDEKDQFFIGDDEPSVFNEEGHPRHEELAGAVRAAAFTLLRDHPFDDQVKVTNRSASTLATFSQTQRLAHEGIHLATGGATLTTRDYLTEDEARWAFAHQATVREASEVLDAFNFLANRLAFDLGGTFDMRFLWDAAHNMREMRRRGKVAQPPTPPFPEVTALPPASQMKVATVAEITLVTPTSHTLAREVAVGMYVVVPADFPSRVTLAVSPVLAWAGHREEAGRDHYFVARPAATAGDAWANYEALAATTRLPETLVRIDGPVLKCRRTRDREATELPYHPHHCEECVYVGCETEGVRFDFYFCVKTVVPHVVAVFNHRYGRYNAFYHDAVNGKTYQDREAARAVGLAAELARRKGLTELYDLPPGTVHDLEITDAADRFTTFRRTLSDLLAGGLSARDALRLPTAEQARHAAAILEELSEGSGVKIAHKHPRAGTGVYFGYDTPLEHARARLEGAVGHERLLVNVEGLGLRTYWAEELYFEGEQSLEDEIIGPRPSRRMPSEVRA